MVSRPTRVVAAVITGLVLATAAVVGLGFGVLYAFNPMGDEYVCSEGEVPGGPAPVGPGEGNDCYTPDNLPAGVEADPFGNRPMSYNCDKDGYRILMKSEGVGAGQVEECVADDIATPSGWALADEE
jgi:hypothetical protein